MSWSISLIGTPQSLIQRLDQESEKLTGQSKVEFDAALPSIKSILCLNYSKQTPVIKLTGNGHQYGGDGSPHEAEYSTCNVSIEPVSSEIV